MSVVVVVHMQAAWPDKNCLMSIKVAQKWFRKKNEWFLHLYKNCLKMWIPKALKICPKSNKLPNLVTLFTCSNLRVWKRGHKERERERVRSSRHSSVVSSAPTILRPRVQIPSTPSRLFQFVLLKMELECEKDEYKRKRGWDWLKRESIDTLT